MMKSSTQTSKTMAEIVPIQFPQIWATAKLIAHDNGLINRFMSEDEYLTQVADIIGASIVMRVIELEVFLKTKNNIQLNIIAAGEHNDAQAELEGAPHREYANTLFNSFFEGI